jgi:hypothetical protein
MTQGNKTEEKFFESDPEGNVNHSHHGTDRWNDLDAPAPSRNGPIAVVALVSMAIGVYGGLHIADQSAATPTEVQEGVACLIKRIKAPEKPKGVVVVNGCDGMADGFKFANPGWHPDAPGSKSGFIHFVSKDDADKRFEAYIDRSPQAIGESKVVRAYRNRDIEKGE